MEKLHTIYYLKGWRLWIYKVFMKHVLPEIEKGWTLHRKLIEDGSVAHYGDKCVICK